MILTVSVMAATASRIRNVLAVVVEALSRTVYTVVKATNASATSNSSSRHLATSTSWSPISACPA